MVMLLCCFASCGTAEQVKIDSVDDLVGKTIGVQDVYKRQAAALTAKRPSRRNSKRRCHGAVFPEPAGRGKRPAFG